MNARDHEYIENRLLAPAVDILDVIERLVKNGKHKEAKRLRHAVADLADICRSVRQDLFSPDRVS